MPSLKRTLSSLKHGTGRVALALVALALTACAVPAPAPQPAPSTPQAPSASPGPVRSLLWVGNSFFYYNNSMHGHVGQLLTAAGAKGHRASSATISGSGLNWHDVEAHLRPDSGLGSYSFVGDNEVRFNERGGKKFDAVMMMDCSQCPIHPTLGPLFHEWVAKHSATARRHGAEPILFMSWAYADQPDMTARLAEQYTRAGRAQQARVVPAGLAFAASLAQRPDVALTVADKRHPSLAGTYLAACTVLASVYRVNPVGNRHTSGLPAEVAAHLQAVAWETVQAFEAQQQQAHR